MDGPVTEIVLGNGLGNALIKGDSISALEQPDINVQSKQNGIGGTKRRVVDPCIKLI
jgi:hypothetical protein